jgi:hypothetical protein
MPGRSRDRAAEVLTELVTIVRTGQGLTGETVERVIQLADDGTSPPRSSPRTSSRRAARRSGRRR